MIKILPISMSDNATGAMYGYFLRETALGIGVLGSKIGKRIGIAS